MAFAWGPRWWFAFGGHLLDGGLEVVPPVRFAKLTETTWRLRNSAGSTWPYSAENPRSPRWTTRQIVDSQGTLLALFQTGLYRRAPEDKDWRRFTDFRGDQLNWSSQALALVANDHILEVYEVYETARDTRGRRRDVILLERDREGRELRRVPLSIPDESRDTPGARGRTLAVASTAQGLLLFQTWIAETGLGAGRLYRLSATLTDLHALCSFAFSPWQHLSIAASSDGELFTNGQSILRTSGEKVRDLESPLESCFWLGRVLHGVRRHPFFGPEIQTRQMKFTQYLAAARGTLDVSRRPSDELLQKATAGVELVPWFLGGVDEAGREDEIVKVAE